MTAIKKQLIQILEDKFAEEDEFSNAEEIAEAEDWAEDAAQRIIRICQNSKPGVWLELMYFEKNKPSRVEELRMHALGKQLGINLFDLPIKSSFYAGELGSLAYSIHMDRVEFFKLLKE